MTTDKPKGGTPADRNAAIWMVLLTLPYLAQLAIWHISQGHSIWLMLFHIGFGVLPILVVALFVDGGRKWARVVGLLLWGLGGLFGGVYNLTLVSDPRNPSPGAYVFNGIVKIISGIGFTIFFSKVLFKKST